MARLFITGDTHGHKHSGFDGYSNRFNRNSFVEQTALTREDVVLIAGDFGGVWEFDGRYTKASVKWLRKTIQTDNHGRPMPHGESVEEANWLDWLEKKSFTTVFCGGNHENYDRLEMAYPEVDFCGGRAHRIREHVYHLMNGYIFTLAGKRVFVFGGASCHDIKDGILDPDEFPTKKMFQTEQKWMKRRGLWFREQYISWWEHEIPVEADMERGSKTLEQAGWNVDLVVTHCLPTGIQGLLGDDYKPDRLTDYLEDIRSRLCFDYWICGHYHNNLRIGQKYLVLYEMILSDEELYKKQRKNEF